MVSVTHALEHIDSLYGSHAELLTGSRVSQTATATSPVLAVPLTVDLITETVNKVSLSSI